MAFGSSENGLTEKSERNERKGEERGERARFDRARIGGIRYGGKWKEGEIIGLSRRTSPLAEFFHGGIIPMNHK